MRIAILAYHATNVSGTDYVDNDHVALAEDLRLIADLGLPVVPLRQAVTLRQGDSGPAVALSCDDGSWFDWHDLPHPLHGVQTSFRTILQEFRAGSGRDASLTSFVIASPEARARLDQRGLVGRGWWGDEWWAEAAAVGIDVQNHSWDHNHDILDATAVEDPRKGCFNTLRHRHEAEAELRQASDYIDARCGAGHTRLFAYPYGQVSEYLVQEYLPRHQAEHRLQAAFTTEPRPLAPGEDRWRLGRYVCGHHWRSPDGLRALLRDALGSSQF